MILALLVCGLAVQDPPPAPTPAPAEAAARHRVGAEDVLRIAVYGHPDLAQEVVVDPDGTFDYPLIGRVDARERTAREIADEIGSRLAGGFVRDPQVRVVVQSPRSKLVIAMGQLSRPGSYPLSEARSLLEILSRAGPVLASAGDEVLVLRSRAGSADDGDAEVIRVDLGSVNAAAGNVVLRAGDTVLVPRASRITVSGAVRTPGAYDSPPGGMTVRQAVALAGGYGRRAARGEARILRPAGGRMTELAAKPDDLVTPGDTVVVEKKKGIF
jgi:polysaccharide export outer membrane protein